MTTITRLTILLLAFVTLLIVAPTPVHADEDKSQRDTQKIIGPDSVDSQLHEDRQTKLGLGRTRLLKSWDDWKADFAERTGVFFGLDYNSLGFVATESPGEDTSAGGAFRLFGTWDFVGQGTKNNGGIIFKFENRHAYTDVAPNKFGAELGYAGFNTLVFSDQGWRVTHLHWRQGFADGRGVAYLGFLDSTDYVDVYALVSPWTGFSNLAFETGSGTIGDMPDGALGAMIGGFVSENIYVMSGIVDANGDPKDLITEADYFTDNIETFKSLEIGWASSQQGSYLLNNIHATIWQVDDREGAGTPSGWGIAFSASSIVAEHWLPFIRGGWSKDGGSTYDSALAIGFGYKPKGRHDVLGVGLHFSRPNKNTFQVPDLDNQFTGEVFYKVQVVDKLEVTASVQVLGNPAFNQNENVIGVFGIRARLSL